VVETRRFTPAVAWSKADLVDAQVDGRVRDRRLEKMLWGGGENHCIHRR
jgi:hypothetical protein